MRRTLSVLFLIATLAPSALAQTARAPVRPAPSSPAPAPSAAAQAVIPPPLPALATPRGERDQPACKAACSRTYYFCRANTDDDSCPGEWARCDARCKASFVRPN